MTLAGIPARNQYPRRPGARQFLLENRATPARPAFGGRTRVAIARATSCTLPVPPTIRRNLAATPREWYNLLEAINATAYLGRRHPHQAMGTAHAASVMEDAA